MQPHRPVHLDLVVEAVRLPGVGEEGDGHRLPKVVQLQPAGARCVEDGGVVDDCQRDARMLGSQRKVGVGGGSVVKGSKPGVRGQGSGFRVQSSAFRAWVSGPSVRVEAYGGVPVLWFLFGNGV